MAERDCTLYGGTCRQTRRQAIIKRICSCELDRVTFREYLVNFAWISCMLFPHVCKGFAMQDFHTKFTRFSHRNSHRNSHRFSQWFSPPDVASKFVCVVGSAVGDVVLCPDGVQEANARDRYKLWTVWRRQALAPSSVQTNSLRGACRIPTTLHGPDAMYCYCMSLASLRQVCVVCVLMVAVLQTPSQDSRPNSLGNINPAPKHAATATHRHQQHATTRERGPTTYGRVTSSRIKVAFDPVTLLQSPSPRHHLAEQTAQRREESLGATGGWPRNGGWG